MRLAALAAALLLSVSGCARDTVTVIEAEERFPDVYAPEPTPPAAGDIPDRGVVYMVRDGRLAPSERPLPEDATSLPEARIRALLGLSAASTAIPSETRALGVGVVGGVATVDLSEDFEQGAPGSTLALRVAQIVFTLTEDQAIRSVLIAIQGDPAPVVAGNERDVLNRPVTRDDYRRFAPLES